MRSRNSVVVLMLVLAATVFGQQRGHRTIEYSPNRTIAERLLPEDKVVTVNQMHGNKRVIVPEPDAAESVDELLLGGYGTAAVIDVTRVSGVLVDEGRWIHTRFQGTVVEILAQTPATSSHAPLATGRPFTLSLYGGELRLGQVLVKTQGSLTFPEKTRYLVFLGGPFDGEGYLMAGDDPVVVRGNELDAVSGSNTKIASLTLERVREIARAIKK